MRIFYFCIRTMIIQRKRYLEQLIAKRGNGRIKIITGIRRCGKSYLLFDLFVSYLHSIGVGNEQIVSLRLDEIANARYRNPIELDKFIRERIADNQKQFYVFLDEIQFVSSINNPYLPKSSTEKITFVDVLLGLKNLENVDIYVTGSNSKMLSSDILTSFRDRADEIRVAPLSFDEFYSAFPRDKRDAWNEFLVYGGMPFLMNLEKHEEKSAYLKTLFSQTYIKDVLERHRIRGEKDVLDDILNFVASAVGSLTNPTRLANTFKTIKHLKVSNNTISNYLDYFVDAFILSKVERYDVKGRSYIGSPLKYYFADIGLRNARLNFRQQEETHLMENVIYNELCSRGFNVDVGIVESNTRNEKGGSQRVLLEIDFVVQTLQRRYYIQSALRIDEEVKRLQETKSLYSVNDSYEKIVVVKDEIIPWTDERGVFYIGIQDFLLNYIQKLQ